ncbi:hypothetical protein [Pseudofrankia asymbiotica]|uniref:Uncharacterized protein n=1 Tax=Pseudofrankia asymbiotica TaxID=1834516 RepID=A0A1V2IGL6_9ACTN|nr:hypothetical protein [Pseudofrankia asymbiotica]ONH32130.1 hypothetical protein BL253_06470 [Pseudofrankia asymbiotica]
MGRWRRLWRTAESPRVEDGQADERATTQVGTSTVPDLLARPAATWPLGAPASDEIGSARQPTRSPPSWARLPAWVRLPASIRPPGWTPRRGRTLLGAGLAVALVAATTVVLTVTPTGKRWACGQLELGCPPPFRVAVRADPDGASPGLAPGPSAVAPGAGAPAAGTASYLFSGDPRGLRPPGGREDCRGWAAWAASIGAASAGATPLRLDVTATGNDLVRVVGFTLRVREEIGVPSLARSAPARLSLTCTASSGAGVPGARQPETERAAEVALNLDYRLFTSQDPVVALPEDQARPIAPGTATAFALTTTTTTCDCRWRVEVELRVGDERKVVTVGPDGARPGTAADNPDQPSFETTTEESGGIPVRYLAGRWQLDLRNVATTPFSSTQDCLLASTPEVIAALDSAGVTARSTAQFGAWAGQEPDDHGTRETALCSWRLPSPLTDLGAVYLEGLTMADEAAARAELAMMREASPVPLVDECGFLSDGPPAAMTAVRGVGDEAASVPGLLIARAGSRIVAVKLCAPAGPGADPTSAPAVPGDPAALSQLARAVLASTW